MRKQQKAQIETFLNLLTRAHEEIKKSISSNKPDIALDLLAQCQDSALQIGETIEHFEGNNSVTIPLLESYCEVVYQVYDTLIHHHPLNPSKTYKTLQKSLTPIKTSVKTDIPVHTEAVFLPYKASMWDSLESVWQAADEDPNCDAYVIPIPYFDKNPDGSFKEEHYEGDLYPDYVPITRYEDYDFAGRQPDLIFIHNPYDECNYVTSVHPFFYSKNLKQFTEKLVYIPYFILGEPNPEDEHAIEGIKHFCTVPGVIYADKVIVQSEAMRKVYVKVLTDYSKGSKADRKYWEEKILGLGSPKVDKVLSTKKEEIEIPDEWKRVIEKEDGSWKKIIFYNTSVTTLLEHEEKYLEKMRDVFRVFKENVDEVALLWRPHPLMQATIESMRPELWGEYERLVEEYREEGWGIYDDTADLDRAIAVCDGYYGDASSVVKLCQEKGKPIMVQNIEVCLNVSEENKYRIKLIDAVKTDETIWFYPYYFDRLFAMNIETREIRYYDIPESVKRNDGIGNFGSMVYVESEAKIYLIPFYAREILQFDILSGKFISITIDSIWLKDEKELFLGTCVYGKYLFVMGVCIPVIIRIDTTNNSIDYITDWKEKVESIIFNNSDAFFRKQSILLNSKLFVPFCNANAVLEIDCESLETTIHKLGNEKEGYSGICFSENIVWLSPRYHKYLKKWNMKTNIVEKIEILNHNNQNYFYIGIICENNSKFLLHALEGKKNVIAEKDKVYELDGNYNFVQNDEDKLIYHEDKTGIATIYYKKENICEEIELKVDKKDIQFNYLLNSNVYFCMENNDLNILCFLDALTRGKEDYYKRRNVQNVAKKIYALMGERQWI